MTNQLDNILSQWARLGATFNVEQSDDTPDIEFLLISTAELTPQFARLLPMTVSWLTQFEKLVCRHRLAVFAKQIQSQEQSAILGYMLSCVRANNGSSHFNLAIQHCSPLPKPQPLYDIDRQNEKLAKLAEKFACKLANKWGLWAPAERFYDDAIRPAQWIMQNNPSLQYRALFAGKLQATIIATLINDPSAGASESALTRACHATRNAIRDALDHLELCGLLERKYKKGLIAAKLNSGAIKQMQHISDYNGVYK